MRYALVFLGLLCGWSVQAQQPDPWQIGPFIRPADAAPVIRPQLSSVFNDPVTGKTVHWEALHTFNPAAIVRDGKIVVLYRAEDDSGEMKVGGHVSRLGLAASSDGIHFTRMPEPVFYAAKDAEEAHESPGGVEDPRVVESEDGMYVLTYTQYSRTNNWIAVGIATSRDLIHWTKHGPLFASDKYAYLHYKSAGIVTQLKRDRLIAAKIHGKYWMYWGEGTIRLATSTDLIHWAPVEDQNGAPLELLRKRAGSFDSEFPEQGPPPVLTHKGIVVLYNGKNAAEDGAPGIDAGAYAVGEALFDRNKPSHLLSRSSSPVLKPEMSYEKTGQYAAGTTFGEGLVYFHHQWLLYYGCADSFVAVAVAPAF